MKTLLPATLAAVATLLASTPADANPRSGNGNGAWTEDGFCPPGLRNRNPPCVPPGQARRGGRDEDRRDRDRDEEPRDLEPEDILREIVRRADNDRENRGDEDRDAAQAMAIIGTLMGLALLEQNAREREDAAPAPVEPEPQRTFSFSDVPSRPASIEALASARDQFSDAADPGVVVPIPRTSPSPVVEDPASLIPPPPPMARIEPLGDPLPGPLPTPQEEAILSDVFRRAADSGTTGY